jgi:hypothetical protein
MTAIPRRLEGLELHRGASSTDLDSLRRERPWLPRQYLQFLGASDGAEGFVAGAGYVRLWSAAAVLRFNSAYAVAEFLPDFCLFGTDAAALGYGFDRRRPDAVVSVEMAALDEEFVREISASFEDFLEHLASEEPLDALKSWAPPEWLRGHVIHEKHPIVLGGPVGDPDNRMLLPEGEHPKAAVYFTRLMKTLRAKANSS